MTKKDENEIISIAEGEIKKFVKEWEEKPYLWESEADVHGELYKRIKSALHKKFPLRKYEYEDMVAEERFDWVYCKPKTYIKGANYPDLVIYKDTGKKRKIGNRENEPMLWACEIKYATEWSSDLVESNIDGDIKKLKELLKQRVDSVGTDCAYLLILFRWMKKYKDEHRCVESKKRIDSKIDKIKKKLDNLKNTKITPCFRIRKEMKIDSEK